MSEMDVGSGHKSGVEKVAERESVRKLMHAPGSCNVVFVKGKFVGDEGTQ